MQREYPEHKQSQMVHDGVPLTVYQCKVFTTVQVLGSIVV